MSKLIFLFLLFFAVVHAQSLEWQTDYELSGFKKTPRYAATIQYSQKLADASARVHFVSFGKSPQGRDLPLLIIDKNGNFTPLTVRESGNLVLLIQAGIHAGESDGKDAGLMLARDIVIRNKYPGLLDNITLLFMPIFNVDGHERFGPYNRINQNGPEEMGYRVTAQNLNLNRDYLKADTPEMQAWLRLYNQWLPEFFIDCHVTDGADYQYTVTYKMPTMGNADPAITDWMNENYIRPMKTAMASAGFPITQYIFFHKRHDVQSGLESWAESPRFSQGYTALRNRPGLLIETHMLKDYKNRVSGTYQMLLQTMRRLGKEKTALQTAIKTADENCTSGVLRSKPFPLLFKDTSDSVIIDFLGVEGKKVKSEVSGGEWFRWFSDRPKTFRVPYFNRQAVIATADLPNAYIIPAEWQRVIERLKLHGVQVKPLSTVQTFSIKTYKFKNAKWQAKPYEGRHPVKFELEDATESREFPAGSVIVPMNQTAARVAAHILEPLAPDSYVRWGFFDAVFERREYAESYALENLARKMLQEKPTLATEFWKKVQSDTAFANSPVARLNFFYQRSPYFDQRWNIYPVGKIYGTVPVN